MEQAQGVGKPKTAEMHPGPGFRLREQIDRCAPDLIDRLADFDAPAVSDQLNRLYTMACAIRPLTDSQLRLVGPACTVKVFPGDNLMVHKSLDIAAPGDVVVVDASSSSLRGLGGPDKHEGSSPRYRRLHRGRPRPRHREHPSARRLSGVRPRRDAHRPASSRARRGQSSDLCRGDRGQPR